MENQTLIYSVPFSQLRKIYNFCKEEKINFKEFAEAIDNYDNFLKLKKSIFEGRISVSDYLNNNYLEDKSYYYDSDYYVNTMEGDICHTDDVYFCEYYEEYTSEETSTVYIGSRRNEKSYCQRAIDRETLYLAPDGDYYDYEALCNSNYVIMENGDIEDLDSVYYWESDGEYHYEPEPTEQYVRDYHHDTSVKKVTFSENPKFFIGFEIEKEDKEVKESIDIDDFEDENPNWRKEKDGSLDDESGYELISPCYELNVDEIKKDIESSKTIVEHINAKKSNSCGGHINISESGLTGKELFEKIEGYTPLFHALYYKRTETRYSKGKSNKDLKESGEKFQSVKIHSNRVEYRIVSAVPNLNTLLWRARLLKYILENPTDSPIRAFHYIQNGLKPLLAEMYPNEKINVLFERVIEFTEKYENIKLSK